MTLIGVPVRERSAYGVDFHIKPDGKKTVGYYQSNRDDRKTLPGPRLDRAEFTVRVSSNLIDMIQTLINLRRLGHEPRFLC